MLVVGTDGLESQMIVAALNGRTIRVVQDATGLLRVLDECIEPLSGLFVDQRHPDRLGIELLAQLRARHAHVPLLIAATHLEATTVNRAAELGAMLIVRPFPGAVLNGWIARITAYERERSPVWLSLARAFDAAPASARERQVIELAIEEEKTYVQIGEALGISAHTARTHARSFMDKLQVCTLQELRRALDL